MSNVQNGFEFRTWILGFVYGLVLGIWNFERSDFGLCGDAGGGSFMLPPRIFIGNRAQFLRNC
jgi:hypothetical protein